MYKISAKKMCSYMYIAALCLFTSDLQVDMLPSRIKRQEQFLKAYWYQASSYLLSTENIGSCNSLHYSVILIANCTLVKKSFQEEIHTYSLVIHTIILYVSEHN